MKVCSYKGHSLEKLHKAIHNELGPEAIIVSSRRINTGTPWNPFRRGLQHELIAVVDDSDLQNHLTGTTERKLDEWTELQMAQWGTMERHVTDLRRDLQTIQQRLSPLPGTNEHADPDTPPGWDPRFLIHLQERAPDFFEEHAAPSRPTVLGELLRVEETFPIRTKQPPHIIVFTGPTGSGKTTTLAKLAARWSLDDRLRVALITTDTFRVAAVDQIKEYATLLGLRLSVSYSATDTAQAVRAFSDHDIILIDTPGRNQYDAVGLSGVRRILSGFGTVSILLMIPATMDRTHLGAVLASYEALRINYVALTKVDEASNLDLLTFLASETRSPLAFITNGQRVPQDIQPARRSDIVRLLLPKET